MAKRQSESEERESSDGAPAGRAIWSGTISFGLVSIPVTLQSGSRTLRVALRMLDADGTPLRRRYACSKENKIIDNENLVRGYEVDDGEFIVVTDEELEALAPEKSRDIDLRRFVKLSEIPPIYFDRPYYLMPAGGSTKAYNLLARTMEDEGFAGIATFVMHENEHLAAILAEKGILRMETLRFADEIRSAEAVEIAGKAGGGDVSKMKKAIGALVARSVDRKLLVDRREQRLMELIEAKDERGDDVVQAKVEVEGEQGNVIDLMQRLKESLQARQPKPAKKTKRGSKSKRRAA